MAFSVSISFIYGRFHATPWEHNVNEGQVEWPPSPWRFLRALVATWKRKFNDDYDVNALMPSICGKLLEAPLFSLPSATLGHSRHYMPTNWKSALVFDAFVALRPKDTVIIRWPDVYLESTEVSVMEKVFSGVHYLGRRESICELKVVSLDEKVPINCSPSDSASNEIPKNMTPIRVMCPSPATALSSSAVLQPLNDKPKRGGKSSVPVSYSDPNWQLCMDTAQFRTERWSDPPGARWVTYWRRTDALVPAPPSVLPQFQKKTYVSARYILDGSVLPLVQDTVYMGEIARQFLMGKYGKLYNGESSRVFSGKEIDGAPRIGHQHAFFLPTDEDGDGRLDHLTVYAPEGFGQKELRSLDELTRLRRPGAGVELNALLLGIFTNEQMLSQSDAPIFGSATRWRSVTPFVAPRNYKRRGKLKDTCSIEEWPQLVLREQIAKRGFNHPEKVIPLDVCSLWNHQEMRDTTRKIRWSYFRSKRVFGAGTYGVQAGSGFIIEFAEPVTGPIALGYGCHYGLGLFAPMK